MPSQYRLSFEREMHEMEEALARLEASSNGQIADSEEIGRLRRELVNLVRKLYSNLSPWQVVEVSRHPERPQTMDYVDLIFDEFVELHGDRAVGDDRALRC